MECHHKGTDHRWVIIATLSILNGTQDIAQTNSKAAHNIEGGQGDDSAKDAVAHLFEETWDAYKVVPCS